MGKLWQDLGSQENVVRLSLPQDLSPLTRKQENCDFWVFGSMNRYRQLSFERRIDYHLSDNVFMIDISDANRPKPKNP